MAIVEEHAVVEENSVCSSSALKSQTVRGLEGFPSEGHGGIHAGSTPLSGFSVSSCRSSATVLVLNCNA